MDPIAATKLVGEIVAENPAIARTFERLGIDYCCQGRRTLEAACAQRGLSVSAVCAAIESAARSNDSGRDESWQTLAPNALADHIEATHHTLLRRELPRLGQLFEKVGRVHGAAHPEVLAAHRFFVDLRSELESHLLKEEQVLFPIVRALAAGQRGDWHCGSIQNPIRAMEHEHGVAGDLLRALRRTTNDYTPPAEACASYRALYGGLHDLETDLHWHIHKENNVLFPRAAEMEQATH